MGRLLEQLQLTPTPIDTVGFRTMLALKETVGNDSFDLFYGLYKYNPNSVRGRGGRVVGGDARVASQNQHSRERTISF